MVRKHNFNAGPSILPLPVLEEARRNLVDTEGFGLSVLEMSHRSTEFDGILSRAKSALGRLLDLPEDYEILFLAGGASLQFAMVPLSLGRGGAYVNTGVWSQKAIEEARLVGEAHEIWTDQAGGFRRTPAPGGSLDVPEGAPYLHITTNNTIYGTRWLHVPEVDVPVVGDMSSDILSGPLDVSKYGLIYAGAQKNAGPSGVTLVIGRRDLLADFKGPETAPTMLRYTTHLKAGSLYNTPSTFGIYLCALVYEWILATGGLDAMARRNEEKARLLYDAIDRRPELYSGHAERDHRSLMNVTFTLPTADAERRFLAEAEGRGCIGLAGHRLVGGLRASIYNAMPLESVEVLVDLMDRFEP